MPVYLNKISLIVKKSSIRKLYLNGLPQFRIDYFGNSENEINEDRFLFSISANSIEEFNMGKLVTMKFKVLDDYNIHSKSQGFYYPSNWLRNNSLFAWHKDDDKHLVTKAEEIAKMSSDEVQSHLKELKLSGIPELLEVRSFPPKPDLEKSTWWKYTSPLSLLAFMIIGYFWWNVAVAAGLALIILIHELGHYYAMKMFGYKNVRLFFIPLFGGAVTGDKFEKSQFQEIFILLAGPVPGIILGLTLMYFFDDSTESSKVLWAFGLGLSFVNWLNVLPLYPVDGGKALLSLFPSKRHLTKLVTISGILVLGVFAAYYGSYIGAAFLGLVLIAQFLDINEDNLREVIRPLGHSAIDKEYGQLSRSEYWLLREEILLNSPRLQERFALGAYRESSDEESLRDTLVRVIKPNMKSDLHTIWKILVAFFLLFVFPFVVPILVFILIIMGIDFSD